MLSSGFLWYTRFRLEFCLCNQNVSRSGSPLWGGQAHALLSSPVGGAGSWRQRSVTHGEGGRRVLLGVHMQVWEPSGKEESLREVANWQRQTVFPNLLSFFTLSHATVSSISDFPQVPAIYCSSHKHAALPFQMQTYLTQEGLCELAPRAWLGWTSPRFWQNCCDQ